MTRHKSGEAAARSLPGLKSAAIFVLAFALAFAIASLARANGDVIGIATGGSISLEIAKGKPRTVRAAAPVHEIVVGDPEIANVSPLTDRSFFVLGNSVGTTGIALFDENRQLVGTIDVEVTPDTEQLAESISEAVPGTDIKVTSANGMIVLSGSAKDAVAAAKAKSIASYITGEENVINSVDITTSQQVQLNVRFVEINREVGQMLGASIGGTYSWNGSSLSFNSLNPRGGGVATPENGINFARLLDNGWSIDATIEALEDRGAARRLAEPNLIARSGETASFLAGGEVPIPVAESEGVISVEYKKFGVGLEFTPTVLADGLISLDIAPEVSSIDRSSSFQISENINLPTFVVRRAETSITLRSGQSFMIAGLLQTQNDMLNSRIPGLGRLPVIGALFSSKEYQRRETDLVIIITPHLIKPIDPLKKPRTPFDGVEAASDADFFLGNVEEVRNSAATRAMAHAYAPGAGAAGPGYGHFLDLKLE